MTIEPAVKGTFRDVLHSKDKCEGKREGVVIKKQGVQKWMEIIATNLVKC